MSFQRYFSPAQFESDQKDLIISQLKADIYELKKNQQDYYEISSQLQSLQNRYEMLQREKGKNEIEYKNRNENSFRQITSLKEDIDSINIVVKSKQMESRELKSDNIQLQELNQQRLAEQQRLNQEMYSLVESIRKVTKDRENAHNQILLAKEDNQRMQMDILETRKDIEDIQLTNAALAKSVQQQESLKSQDNKAVASINLQIQELRINLNLQKDSQFYQQQSIQNQQQRLSNYEEEFSSLKRQKEQIMQEDNIQQKDYNQSQLQGKDFDQILLNINSKLSNKLSFINDIKDNIKHIRNENEQIIQANQQLNFDVQELKNYINLIMISNQKLVEEMESMNEMDEQMRVILNRKARVKDIKLRTIQNTNRMTQRLDHTSQQQSQQFNNNNNYNSQVKHNNNNSQKKSPNKDNNQF